MKHSHLSTLLLGLALTAQSQQAQAATQVAQLPDDEAMVYAFMPFDYERFAYTHSFVKFQTNFPEAWSFYKIADFDTRKGTDYPEITAGTFVGDEYWAFFKAPYDLNFWEPMGLYKVDIETGEYALIDNCYWYQDESVLYPMDMSYDPSTGLIWYVAPITSNPIQFNGFADASTLGWALCYIDTQSANPHPVRFGNNLPQCVTCVAADHGKLYGLAIERSKVRNTTITSFVEITPDLQQSSYDFNVVRKYAEKELHISGPTDWASMEWDRTNHRLYASYTELKDEAVYFSEFDPATGDILKTTWQGGAIMVNAMAIPYQTCPDEAPFYPGNFTVTTGAAGNPTASLTWERPTQTYMKQPLMEMDGYRIYRDGEQVAELNADATSWNESNVPFGLHDYTIAAYNHAGEGISRTRTAFVGKDTPGIPGNLTFTAQGSTANLSWQIPTDGAHGAWYDMASVTYTITRHPDEVQVVSGLTKTRYTDVVDVFQGYSYTITACNHEGEGLSATTQILSFGPDAGIPFLSDLRQQAEFLKWEVCDSNHDGYTWAYSDGLNATIYDATFCENKPDDQLISPVIQTQAGQQYKLTYQVKVHNYIDTEEKFAWYAGPADASPTNKGIEIDHGTYTSRESLQWFERQCIFDGTEGGNRLTFDVLSDPLQGILYLGDITVRLYSDNDLAIKDVAGSEMAGQGRATPILVTIKNEGRSTVRHFSIRVWDEEGDATVTQEFNIPIESEETLTCNVSWTPQQLGMHHVHAEVILEGDTFLNDNTCDDIHQIDITEAGDKEWMTIGQYDKSDSNWCGIEAPYSQSQALYLAEEINLEPGTKILGIGFAYDGNDALRRMTGINFEVSLGNSLLPALYDYYEYIYDWNYYPHLLTSDHFPETPFVGFADVNAPTGAEGHLMFEFDEPFEYGGDNLLVKVVRTTSSKVADTWVLYHMQILDGTTNASIDPNGRAIYASGSSEVAEGSKARAHGYNQLPVLYLCYDTSDGIRAIKTIAGPLTADARNGMLHLSQPCRQAVLTDLSGRVIFQGTDVQQIPVHQASSSVAILRATLADGTAATLKVVVK